MPKPGKVKISIHALLAESDLTRVVSSAGTTDFYPRSPCGERRPSLSGTAQHTYFYPRSPCGERQSTPAKPFSTSDFYPRSPCGERQPTAGRNDKHNVISIHALLAESDAETAHKRANRLAFLSTLSLRRATNCTSIGRPKRLYFYPRSPCGERLSPVMRMVSILLFLSTLSLRRATPPSPPKTKVL